MKSSISRLSNTLFSPTDAASLGMFRILFGALMFWQAFYYLGSQRYAKYYLEPSFHFTYDFFHWVAPLPENYFYWVFILMAAAGLGIMLGFCYRISVFLFLISFSYVFLLDKAYFNNHYYAIILLTFLMLVTDGHRWVSLDQKFKPKPAVIPYWHLFILRAQILIIYFFGGIAKLNEDWLQGEPMRTWLKNVSTEIPIVGEALATEWAAYFFSWGGLAFDLSIGFLLWWRKTRVAAFLTVLFFNLTNSVIFSIGVFPFLMIATATLFDEPDWPRKFFKSKHSAPLGNFRASDFKSRTAWVFLTSYLLIQVLVPFRHWLYPGNVSWTEEGHFFSWHMKLRDKKGTLKVWVTVPKTDTTYEVDARQSLNRFQYGKMLQRPQFILQLVHYLRGELEKKGIENPIIRVDSMISLNGRPLQTAIDPNINLAELRPRPFAHETWILPLDPSLKPGTRSASVSDKEKKDPDDSPGSLDQENN